MNVRVRLEMYDWIVLNTSAGKDSQAMMDFVFGQAKRAGLKDRVVAVHCDLGEEEWPGTRELAEEHARHYGIRFEVVKRKQGGILAHVQQRAASLAGRGKKTTPPWPSSEQRWCTSDHKRGPVSTLLTRLANETRLTHPGKRVRILNCLGMRAAESLARQKLLPFRLDRNNTNGRRVVHTWLPLHAWTAGMVWSRIRYAGTRVHGAYALGMPRLSCCFCIFAPRSALILAGRHNPDLLDRYCEVEEKTGFSFRQELPLVEVRAAIERGVDAGPITTWEGAAVEAGC